MERKQNKNSVYKKIRRELYIQVRENERKGRRKLIVCALATLLCASLLLFCATLLETSKESKYTYVYGDGKQVIPSSLVFADDTQYIDLNALADFCGMEKGTFFAKSMFKINGTEAGFENGSKTATVNGFELEMPSPAVIKNGYCLIPIESAKQIFREIEISTGESETSVNINAEKIFMITSPNNIEYITDISKYLGYISSSEEYIYILANKQNPLKEGFAVPDEDLTEIPSQYRKDSRIYLYTTAEMALEAMMQDMYEAGHTDTYVTSAYRSYEYQEWLFNKYIEQEMAGGLSREDAIEKVLTYSSEPGKSEHHTGLCIDFTTKSIGGVVEDVFETTEVYAWLIENSWKYGFVLRYPSDKMDITGYSYEPWHYRFVGLKVASEMHQTGLCYEEYLEYFNTKGE
ncbi:MAG: D-alanyl-D-alanine carboxypeptidase family protein [Eubacteriales bacterium]